ncbi:polysaccharide biosynthesis protein [Pedobacter frigidisoli]|uniref:Polysaccharide biosynthesis protein n=1 Tax=Pedobacter frigidisoli TaxID=2530455 RepID=A0A4R0NM80_9SPHI|nr:oligosaccharide flippase family protein [Pedobacter frigidisoli]TCD01960.1 polysaccharide biosynthesis protein [Pedobacter frigidisoli]
MKMKELVISKVGIDRAIAYTIFSRIIQAGGGVFSVVFIAKFLSATEQGYYYTFSSIIALQIFFELGLSSIITQYASHEFAHLSISEGKIIGDVEHLSRLSSLLRFSLKWFSLISLGLFSVLLFCGTYFFDSFNNNENVNWQAPWMILCIATAINLIVDPILAFLDGIGFIGDMSRTRLIQKTINIVLLFILLFGGFGLYSAAIASLVAITFNAFQIIFSSKLSLLRKLWHSLDKAVIKYSTEIFPYQWKVAISWISGYFIFYFFNPVLFATEGPVVAGQMGMTLAVLAGISSISMSWINTKVPLFSTLIAKKQFNELDSVFKSVLVQLSTINLLGLVAFIFGIVMLSNFGNSYSIRFLPITATILLSLVTFINQFIGSWATYLRCFKKEPFLVASVVVAALCVASTLVFGKIFGAWGMVVGYTSIVVVVSLPWAYIIFKNKSVEFKINN